LPACLSFLPAFLVRGHERSDFVGHGNRGVCKALKLLPGPVHVGEIDMRTFVAGATKIDVIAHISREDLELDRLVLCRFEGSETIANAAFQTLVHRYGGRPLAEYALAPQEIDLN
jgi:hypothetical protein